MKIYSIAFYCTVSLMVLSSKNALAQLPSGVQDDINNNMPNPVPASPNVAALAKFGDYQTNYFTGLQEISIPIFDIKSRSIDIPITLSYHATWFEVRTWKDLQ